MGSEQTKTQTEVAQGQEGGLAPALTREAIAQAALSLVDLPFKHHGRDEQLGLDCAGVLVAAFRKCGVELLEEEINYRPKPDEGHVVRCLEMNFQFCSYGDDDDLPIPGDILHLKFKRDTAARHLGIVVKVTGIYMLVHAVHLRRDRRVLLEPLSSVLQNATIAGIYQWPRLQS